MTREEKLDGSALGLLLTGVVILLTSRLQLGIFGGITTLILIEGGIGLGIFSAIGGGSVQPSNMKAIFRSRDPSKFWFAIWTFILISQLLVVCLSIAVISINREN